LQVADSQFRAEGPLGTSQILISHWLLILGLLLTGIGGAFLPWIWYDSVALQLTAPGLAEFVKFLPEVRLGQVQVQRLYFLLPLFVADLGLPLFAANRRLLLPGWWRVILRLAVVPLALASLSPVWTPAVLISAEFRWQTLLAAVAIGLAMTAPLFKRLPLSWLTTLLLVGGCIALILPPWQFELIQPAVAEAYHDSVALSWGWQLTAGGIILSIIGGLWASLQPH
jgi:hypothetical protein